MKEQRIGPGCSRRGALFGVGGRGEGRGEGREVGWGGAEGSGPSPDVVRHGQRGAPVQQDLDDLVVVPVRRQDERGDVRREGGRVGRQRLPALRQNRPVLISTVNDKTTPSRASPLPSETTTSSACFRKDLYGVFESGQISRDSATPFYFSKRSSFGTIRLAS